jgi:drug/metabolite transporter (DMT)-like permease
LSAAHPTGNRAGFSDATLAWYFVIVWGSGFLATKTGIQYAVLKPRWPANSREWMHVVIAGLLMHAIHLSGSHYAQYLGMSAGITAVILASQPLLTAMFAAGWLGERPNRRQWTGIAIGLIGVAMVVWHKIDIAAVTAGSLIAVATGVAALTAGTLYQRRYCASVDLRSSAFVQFVASLAVLAPLSFAFEGARIQWAWQLIVAVLFLVIFASVLAVNALHTLMRRGEATRVSSMLYLPPVVAIALEWLMFGVVPTALSLVGVAVTCAGVALAARK